MGSLDKNVGEALLRLDLSPQADPPVGQIERIIDEDRRRVKRWTRISIALWIVAALGAMVIFVMGGFAFPMIAHLVMQEKQGKVAAAADETSDHGGEEGAATKAKKGPLDEPNTSFTVLAKLVAMCVVIGTAAFMVLVFAGLATVLLLLRSRSATLRQINANLLQIAEQLKSGVGKSPGAT